MKKHTDQVDDQAFVTEALRAATGDETEQKRVLLYYQQAVMQTLYDFQPCTNCAFDLTLLKKRSEKLLETTHKYLNTVAIIPVQQVMDLITQSQTILRDVAQLCPACQATIKHTILATFRATVYV